MQAQKGIQLPGQARRDAPRRAAPPPGALFLGMVDGAPVYLTARDRSLMLLLIGPPGSGKTVTMEAYARQDIDYGRGLMVIDPMGALVDRLLAYIAYRTATGRRVPEVIVLNASGGEWVLPINPFERQDREISVQVDRRVASMLRVWHQATGDYTPRLEKWLKILFTVLIECGLTVLEAGLLLDQHQHKLREALLTGLSNSLIRSKFEQLSRYKLSEYLQQTESTENRLLRFLTSDQLGRIFGTGLNALDLPSIMDEGKIVLVNLKPSSLLSREQGQLIGTWLLSECFEAALSRQSGSRPYYCWIDEAAQFVSEELAAGLETCRQKGFHMGCSFQHTSQFKEAGERVYKAFMNVRNKIAFGIPSRQDALELADDLFVGLTEPQVKFVHRRLSHRLIDTRGTSTTESAGGSRSETRSRSRSKGNSTSESTSRGQGESQTESRERGSGKSSSLASTRSREQGSSHSRTRGRQDSHSWGYGEAASKSMSTSTHSATTTSESSGWYRGSSTGTSSGEAATEGGEPVVSKQESNTNSEGESGTRGRSETTGSSETEGRTHGYSHSSQETWGQSAARTTGSNRSAGQSRTESFGQNTNRSRGRSRGRSSSTERSRSRGESSSTSAGTGKEQGRSWSKSTTDQPMTLHEPFWEEDPEHWSLEEQRWRASELLMGQQVGHWYLRTETFSGFGCTRLPQSFYLTPKQLGADNQPAVPEAQPEA
jgi:hypothetical protein